MGVLWHAVGRHYETALKIDDVGAAKGIGYRRLRISSCTIFVGPWPFWAKNWKGPGIRVLNTHPCNNGRIEEELFHRHRNLFSTLDLVFFDNTSIYFAGQGAR